MVALKSILVLFFVGLVVAKEAVQPAEPEFPEGDVSRKGVSKPTCNHNQNTVSCCMSISVKGHPLNTCIELSLKINELKAVAALKVNDHNIISKDAGVGKACAPLPPPLSLLKSCLHVYYAAVNIKEKSADVCFVFEVSHVLQVRFDCFRLRNGKFDHHSEHPPEKHGFVNIGWHNGKPSFHVNKPGWLGKIKQVGNKIIHH